MRKRYLEGSSLLSRRSLLRAATVASGSVVLSKWASGASAAASWSGPKVTRTALQTLERQLDGQVVSRQCSNYEEWRQRIIWNNRKFSRYPDLIVEAASAEDVSRAVRFARQHELKVKTRSGGHSWSGCYLPEDGLVIDVSRLQSIHVDSHRHIVAVEPGVFGRALNSRLSQDALAFPTAHCGMVPISGFVLGGGIGWNGVAWGGLSGYNIEAVDVVTSEGEHIHATENSNSDYFWAARGGGPGLFFTVTQLHLRCFDEPRSILESTYILPGEELAALAEALNELGPDIDPAVELLAVMVASPEGLRTRSGPYRGRHVAVLNAIAFATAHGQAKRMLSPVAAHPTLRKAILSIEERPVTFEDLYRDNEAAFPQRRAKADNIFTNDVVGAAAVLGEHMPEAPSDGNSPVLLWRGPESEAVGAGSSHGRFYVATYAQWDNNGMDADNSDWLIGLYDGLQPFASGYYINEFDREARAEKTPQCYRPENWEHLRYLREKHDPAKVFHDFLGIDA